MLGGLKKTAYSQRGRAKNRAGGSVEGSLDVLHLLTELLDRRFKRKPDPRQLYIRRFRAQGVGFAIKLLAQEIQATPDRLFLPQQAGGLLDMRPQPLDLLA